LKNGSLFVLVGACVVSGAYMATLGLGASSRPLSTVLGLPLALLLPGCAAVCSVIPRRDFSGDRLLVGSGLSLAISTCVAVGLAAANVGLTRASFGYALGGLTLSLSLCALYRLHTPTTFPPSMRDDDAPF
jgi:uncharacterized membrane protein